MAVAMDSSGSGLLDLNDDNFIAHADNACTSDNSVGKRAVSRRALNAWEPDLKENFIFSFNEDGDKAIKAICKVCEKKTVTESLHFIRGK